MSKVGLKKGGRGELTIIVIIKKAVQPSTIDQNILRVEDTKTPSLSDIAAVIDGKRYQDGIIEASDGWEWYGGNGVRLIVCCFRLDLACKDVHCIGELVLIQRKVFYSCADSETRSQYTLENLPLMEG